MDSRTSDPLFYCLRLKETDRHSYRPPFKRGFYFVGLLTNAEKTKITYDNTSVDSLDSLLVFQSPGLVYSFYRSGATKGYLIYFKPHCFAYFRPSIDKEFPFFNLQRTDFFRIDQTKYVELAPHFEDVFRAYEGTGDNQHKVASLKLLALLYQLKEVSDFNQWQERFATPQQVLFRRFIALVNTHYIDKRRVVDYADLLSVTPNYLSQSIKNISGRNALSYINERITTEAKSLIRYTELDINQIAYQLNFSDPANFGKLFKKMEGVTPLQYRAAQ